MENASAVSLFENNFFCLFLGGEWPSFGWESPPALKWPPGNPALKYLLFLYKLFGFTLQKVVQNTLIVIQIQYLICTNCNSSAIQSVGPVVMVCHASPVHMIPSLICETLWFSGSVRDLQARDRGFDPRLG